MLKPNRLKLLIALMLVAALMVGPTLSVCGQNAATQIHDNELVITTLDDNGKIAGIKVLDHLRVFGSGQVSIQDKYSLNLNSARNMYGTEKIQFQNGSLALNTNIPGGKEYQDLYYLAELDKKELTKTNFPVSVNLEYYLDGKKVSAAELRGKSGHMKIVCHLENLTGQTRMLEFTDANGQVIRQEATVYTPYVVSLSGWEFDNRKFSNIKAPGIAGESPEGVIVDVQGMTSVTWSVPMVPPKYPAKQYTVLEADGKNIEFKSFNIAVIPILPTTSEADTLGSVQDSLGQLYGAFDQIQTGVGAPGQNATLLFGLKAVKDGIGQVSSGLNSLSDKLMQIRTGMANPAFNAATYDPNTGADAGGNTPGVKDAISLCKSNIDDKVMPALGLQKTALDAMNVSIGSPADSGQEPSAETSLYNDLNYVKGLVAGSPAEKVITGNINPKLQNMSSNLTAVKSGGTLVTANGSMQFPASVAALEEGMEKISTGLGKANSGLGLMVLGLGPVDKNGKPVKVMIDGKPGSILYALSYMDTAINAQLVPGITQIQEGTGKIGEGSGLAKDGIAAGLQTMQSVPALMSTMEANLTQADIFLGKPEGALGTVTYIYQTPEVSTAAAAMNYGLGAIVLAFIILLVAGRPPKQIIPVPAEENKNI